jgi:hypothetical protein
MIKKKQTARTGFLHESTEPARAVKWINPGLLALYQVVDSFCDFLHFI